MATCDLCGTEETLPYNCRYCGGQFCSEHRLPENHHCVGLEEYDSGGGVFDSGFDSDIESPSSDRSVPGMDLDMPRTGLGGYIRNNTTYLFLVIIWVTFMLQLVALLIGGDSLHRALFVLSPDQPEYVWTWVTSVFAHSPDFLAHIVFNSIVIFFFGPLVERYIGSRSFAVLFIGSGAAAGLSQVAITILESPVPAEAPGVLGASGAALAIMGVLTLLNPNLRVLFFGIVPMPLWVLTVGIAAISFIFVASGAAGAGGIAHAAHLVGLLIGLAYGWYLKSQRNIRPPRRLQLGGQQRRGGGRF